MAMPERIWAGSKAAIGAPDTGDWHPAATLSTPTEYVRATTHQRTLEALREAERALQRVAAADFLDLSFAPERSASPIARAALAKIKEATDGR